MRSEAFFFAAQELFWGIVGWFVLGMVVVFILVPLLAEWCKTK